MLRNLLTVAYRNLLLNRTYTALHLVGLTLGLTCTLFLGLYILDELGFDQFHSNKDRIHRIVTTLREGGKETDYNSTQVPVAVELEAKYPEVERAIRFLGAGRELFEVPESGLKFYEEDFYFADEKVFDVFSFPLLSGDPAKVLTQPNTAVISEATSQKYFGTSDAIGKTFSSKGKTYSVTGIAMNVPANSSLKFDALLSFSSLPSNIGSWDSWYPDTYVLIAAGRTAGDVENALAAITREHVTPLFENYGIAIRYWLQPITDIHLEAGSGAERGDASDYIYIFFAIAAVVIVIACINYINLATARAARRAKEIGIRKTIGSAQRHIIAQFVAESTLLTIISLCFSFALVSVLLPQFNALAGKSIELSFLFRPNIVVGCLALALSVGLIGGSYPAFYLSHFNPALVLKGNLSRGAGGARLRQVLVATQFAISIAVLICTAVVYDQLSYMGSKDLGFEGDQVVHVELADSATMASESALTEKLREHSRITGVASSSSHPGKGINYSVMQVDSREGVVPQGVYYHYANYDFPQVLGLTITEGRSFSRDYLGDTTAALVNESMVKSMQWNDPIGRRFIEDDGNPSTQGRFYTVVGVMKDYHQSSLHSPITPLAIFFKEPNYFLNIKVVPGDMKSTIDFISTTWAEVTGNKPFAYSFLDADFAEQYETDQKRGQIFSAFALICMVISCVGLFGLAAYTTEQRAREIGIRKVIGASVPAILQLFYTDFLKLILVGLSVAFPTSYFVMSNWLETFAYQTDWHWITFAGSAVITVVITMGTISFHAIRAATTNPSVTLRSE
jgi:putative ABC transport system permease protein